MPEITRYAEYFECNKKYLQQVISLSLKVNVQADCGVIGKWYGGCMCNEMSTLTPRVVMFID